MINFLTRNIKKATKLIGISSKKTLDSTSQHIFKKLKKGSIAIDCGANVGVVTKKMAKAGGTVYAFEPNPFAFKVLEDSFKQDKNVHCFQKGVLDKDTKLQLYFHENSDENETYWSTGSSFLSFKKNVNKEKSTEVEVIDLDKFIRSLKTKVSLVKLDVEGVEIEIVNKLIDTGTIHLIDQLVVETHERKIPELLEKTEKLKERIKLEKLKNINLNWI